MRFRALGWEKEGLQEVGVKPLDEVLLFGFAEGFALGV